MSIQKWRRTIYTDDVAAPVDAALERARPTVSKLLSRIPILHLIAAHADSPARALDVSFPQPGKWPRGVASDLAPGPPRAGLFPRHYAGP